MEEGLGGVGYPREIELRFIQELEDWILGGGRVSWSRHQTWGRRRRRIAIHGNGHHFRERKEDMKGILTQVYLGPII